VFPPPHQTHGQRFEQEAKRNDQLERETLGTLTELPAGARGVAVSGCEQQIEGEKKSTTSEKSTMSSASEGGRYNSALPDV
jgi:hypothetical protein